MNKKDQLRRNDTQRNYHTPNNPCKPRERNAVYLNPSNSWEHEKKKCEVCFKLQGDGMQFITEASNRKGERIDIVCLDTGEEIEIVHKHLNLKDLTKKGRIIVMTNEAKAEIKKRKKED